MPQRSYTTPLCHCAVIRQAARQVTQLYDRHLEPTGLRITQVSVLRHIRRHGPMTMQEFAEIIVMDRTTVTRALRPLQRDGFVTVEPGKDGRTRRLRLTEAGRALLERSDPLWDRAQSEFETRFGGYEAEALRGMLSRVVTQMD